MEELFEFKAKEVVMVVKWERIGDDERRKYQEKKKYLSASFVQGEYISFSFVCDVSIIECGRHRCRKKSYVG